MAQFTYTATVVLGGGNIRALVTANSQTEADGKLSLALSGGQPPIAQPNPDVSFEIFVAPSAFVPGG